jgi:hypothetical protein
LKEFYWENLKPWEHYIPIKDDMTDLIEKTKWCMENYEKACEIAKNAYEYAKKYVTQEACYVQWNRIITDILNKKCPY